MVLTKVRNVLKRSKLNHLKPSKMIGMINHLKQPNIINLNT